MERLKYSTTNLASVIVQLSNIKLFFVQHSNIFISLCILPKEKTMQDEKGEIVDISVNFNGTKH